MAGEITIKFTVMKNGMADLAMKSPIYVPGPVEPQFGPGRYIYFEGFSVDENGKQHYLDATVAYRQTTLRCIEYLRRYGALFSFFLFFFCQKNLCFVFLLLFPFFGRGEVKKVRAANESEIGYDDYQIYLLLSCAPVQGHIAGIVDVPNACTTLGLPMDIFEFDISPLTPAKKIDLGSCAFTSK